MEQQQQQLELIQSIVYHALISICGREIHPSLDHLPCCCSICSSSGCFETTYNNDDTTTTTVPTTTRTSVPDDENKNHTIGTASIGTTTTTNRKVAITAEEIQQQWRHELYTFVKGTIHHYDYSTKNTKILLERTKMYDIEIRTATSYFQRYKKNITIQNDNYNNDKNETSCVNRNKTLSKRKKQNTMNAKTNRTSRRHTNNATSSLSSSSSYCICIESDMGVQRIIHSSYQLAKDYIVPYIEQYLDQYNISTHIRVSSVTGFICCISHTRMEQIQRIQQQQQALSSSSSSSLDVLQSCPICPLWCNGHKGLWWHLQQQHNITYHTAIETSNIQYHRNDTAIIVYNPITIIESTAKVTVPRSSVDTDRERDNVVYTIPPIIPIVGSRTMSVNNDPWDCIKHNGTLNQFIQCINYKYKRHIDIDDTNRNTVQDQYECIWNDRDQYGAVLLHWAAGKGNLDIVQYIVEQLHCPINIIQHGKRSYYGRTPLHWASRYGHYHTVQYIVQQSFNNARSCDVSNIDLSVGNNCYSNSGDTYILDNLTTKQLTLLNDCIEARTIDGTTSFCLASWQGHIKIMQLLHNTYGCQSDTINQFGCNALLWAAQGCCPSSSDENMTDSISSSSNSTTIQILEWLVKVDCPFLIRNHSGHGILHKGAQRGNYDVCSWFINRLVDEIKLATDYKHHENKIRENDVNKSNYATILDVLGPDNDGCTSSDLAGMENFVELAVYISEQEQRLVRMVISILGINCNTNKRCRNNDSLPEWLSPLPSGVVNDSNASANIVKQQIWEPGSGVYRMRCVFNETSD